MAPTIGRVALDNGFHGSIPGDWVAPPPQNIHVLLNADFVPNISYDMKFCPYYFQRSRILGQSLPEIDFDIFTFIWIHIISRPESGHIPVTYGVRYISLAGSVASRRLKLLRKYHYRLTDHRRKSARSSFRYLCISLRMSCASFPGHGDRFCSFL